VGVVEGAGGEEGVVRMEDLNYCVTRRPSRDLRLGTRKRVWGVLESIWELPELGCLNTKKLAMLTF
jgi:hypothetical protein